MTNPSSTPEPFSSRLSGWTRARIIFLSISATIALSLLLWAGEVLLPFIVAVIVAYVLTPLVARCEKLQVPRALSILVVYVLTIGGIYVVGAAIFPRVYSEGIQLMRDTPKLARDLSAQWAPRIETWVDSVLGRGGEEPPPAPETGEPALEIIRHADGSYGITVGTGIDVVQHGPGHWRVGPPSSTPAQRFDVNELTGQGIDEFFNYVKANALELIRIGHSVIRRVARGIFLVFMTLMVAGYLMHTRESIQAFFRSLVPTRSRIGFDRLLWRVDRGLAGVVRGQLLICLVNGGLSAIGFWLFDLKYWPILAIVAGMMSIIPIFGSILSSVPVVMIGLTQGLWTAVWVLLWIIGIHQIEANLLNPKIIGVVAKIHPVLVVMALLIGEHFYGLWGALLAVPAWSIAQSIFNHFRYESMPDAPPDSLLPPQVSAGRRPASG